MSYFDELADALAGAVDLPEETIWALTGAAFDFLLDHDPHGERQAEGAPLVALHNWPTNAAMIADIAARFDYLDGAVYDCTYGYGAFWSEFKPATFTASDVDPAKSPIGYSIDARATGFDDASFDCVVADFPYKLAGQPLLEVGGVDERFGVIERSVPWRARHDMIKDGITECARITRAYVLVKCQDQVNSGHVRWQVDEFTQHAETVGLVKVDQFAMLGGRPQPSGRSQQHARRNCSTLLVFKRTAAPSPQGALL